MPLSECVRLMQMVRRTRMVAVAAAIPNCGLGEALQLPHWRDVGQRRPKPADIPARLEAKKSPSLAGDSGGKDAEGSAASGFLGWRRARGRNNWARLSTPRAGPCADPPSGCQ